MITDADYPDRRDEAQRRRDSHAAAGQSAALNRANADQRAEADPLVDQLLAKRQAVTSDPAPFPVDVLRRPGSAGHGDESGVLVVRGQLLLRVPTGATLSSGHADAAQPDAAQPGGDVPAYQQAAALLESQGFDPPVDRDFRRDLLPLRTFTAQNPDADTLVKTRELVRSQTGAEVDFNYVCTTGHIVKGDDYPVETAGLLWSQPNQALPAITVAVIDTGINRELRTDGWLASIAEDAQNEDPLEVVPADGVLDDSAGHGTFVSGVIQQVAPQATVTVYRAVDSQGMGQSDDIGTAIVKAAADGANIINLSLGTSTVDDQPPLAFTTALQTLQEQYPGVLVVASAGNNGDSTLMFPAAMEGVTGVGALTADLAPADWSSFGYWLECSAVGVGVTSTFVKGVEQHDDGTGSQEFGPDAWAVWSGTSFSAAQITGAVAQLCQANDVDPAAALAQLLGGRATLDGYGYLVKILPGS
jgi:thermitase